MLDAEKVAVMYEVKPLSKSADWTHPTSCCAAMWTKKS
jgi:hypothetical protein